MRALLTAAVVAATLTLPAALPTVLPAALPAASAPHAAAATPAAPAAAPQTAVWTAPAATDTFPDALPTADASHSLDLQSARNAYESGQILIRKDTAFTIGAVRFSALSGGGHTIAAGNLRYHFLDYTHLNHNSVFGGNQPVDLLTRTAPGEFPDGLSNDLTRTVPKNRTQPVWVTAYVPKQTAAGRYSGTATVHTDHGDSTVPVSVTVHNVTIPDSVDSTFTTSLWSLTTGALSWDEGKGDTIELFYGTKRYSARWWKLMESFAADMKAYRNNDLTVNVVRLLLDGGSTVDAHHHYTFDWSRFDQYIRFFLDRHAVKQLEGFWMTGYALGRPTWQTETIGRDPHGKPVRQYVDWQSDQATAFTAQLLPALRRHLTDKGWAARWWMHVSDEPTGATAVANWQAVAARTRSYWPDVRLADAIYDQGSAAALAPHESFLIPNELAHNPNAAFYDAQVKAGKPVWMYNCNIPVGMYLNRFVDQPQYDQRLTLWYAFEHGITGYLHWAFNNWQYTVDDQDVKGDGYIVLPDKKHNTLEPTIRYESLRDGLQDYELLSTVAKRDPALAQGIAHSLVTDATRYSRDTAYLQRMHGILLAAAAGEPEQTAMSTTSSTLDLGRQYQLDAVTVGGAPAAVTVQISFDGTTWADAYSGPGRFAGLNDKARYVRVTGGGTGLAVLGRPLPRPDLAGGRPYTFSATPDHPDGGHAVTDGVLAGGVGFDVPAGETRTVTATVDLGAATSVADVAVRRHPDAETHGAPDDVAVAVSTDGTHFTPKGRLRHATDADNGWFVFDFPSTVSRYVRVTYEKTGGDALSVDEIEAYGPANPADTDVALGASYTKSAEPDDPMFVDTGGTESTDGVLSGDFTDRYGYAYYLGGGQTRTISITVDLGRPVLTDLVRFRAYDDGDHDYAPDKVAVYTRTDTSDFRLAGRTSWATGSWFDVAVPRTSVSAVRIDITKTDARLADYLFVDEIAVMGDLAASPQNVAAGRPYTKSTDGLDPAWPDTNDADSTDGVLAGGYPDHRSYGYDLSPGQTRTVDVTVDLGRSRTLALVKIWRYNDGVHHYQPDRVTVSTSTDGHTFVDRGSDTAPDERWFAVGLSDVPARYVRITATKTYGDFADYIFLDEIQAYGR